MHPSWVITPNDVIHFWIAATSVALLGAGALGYGWYRAIARLRTLESQMLNRLGLERPATELDDLCMTVAALAEQVDRVADGQEFLSRLVTERRPDLPMRNEPPRLTTPH